MLASNQGSRVLWPTLPRHSCRKVVTLGDETVFWAEPHVREGSLMPAVGALAGSRRYGPLCRVAIYIGQVRRPMSPISRLPTNPSASSLRCIYLPRGSIGPTIAEMHRVLKPGAGHNHERLENLAKL